MDEKDILFENESFFAVDKPWGWLTTPSRHGSDDPRPCLGLWLQKQRQSQIYPVHRLDFAVSGLVLWAKNESSHRISQKWFEFGELQKTYQALSRVGPGEPPKQWQDWHSLLAKGKRRAFEAEYGKPSHTRARVVEEENDHWLWELMPITGRPHQLRFEMAKHDHVILGDELYSTANRNEHAPRTKESVAIALRAVQLDFSKISHSDRLGLPEKLRASDLRWPPP